MSFKSLCIAVMALAVSISAQAGDTPVVVRAKLEKILACQKSAEPDEVFSLIKKLGGLPIVQTNTPTDAEYTLPNALKLFGRPVTKISIHSGQNADGAFYEYGSIFTGESVDTIAKFARITPDKQGSFRKEIGGHDLILRPEAGATYIVCAQDVRTLTKTVKRTAKQAGESFKSVINNEQG